MFLPKSAAAILICALSLFASSIESSAQTAEERQALAPKGKLRAGFLLGSSTQAIKDPVSGEMKGVGFDLAKAMAERLGVPFEPLTYDAIGKVLDAGKAGEWDVAFIGYNAERAKEWDYAPVHIEVEFGFLVPTGSKITSIDNADSASNKIVAPARSLPARFVTGWAKQAAVIEAATKDEALKILGSGGADAFFDIKPNLFDFAAQIPSAKVLEGRPGVDRHAMAMPQGRSAGAKFARQFIEDAKAKGLVKAAIERAGLRGVVVAAGS